MMLADQDWCAAHPKPMRITGNQGEIVPSGCAKRTTNGTKAKINIARIRAA